MYYDYFKALGFLLTLRPLQRCNRTNWNSQRNNRNQSEPLSRVVWAMWMEAVQTDMSLHHGDCH